MTGVVEANPQLFGIGEFLYIWPPTDFERPPLPVNYAAAVAFEVRQPNGGGDSVIRFRFKNGTDDEFNTYSFMNSTSDVPVQTFINTLKVWLSCTPLVPV